MKNNFFFFLVSPFLGFIQAFKHHKEDWAKNAVWVFVVFYGFTMLRPEIMDSSRYVLKLEQLYSKPVSWNSFLQNLYSVDERGSGDVDLYQPIVTYAVAIFTDNGNILFAVFGLVFGYFYSRNIWMLFKYAKKIRMNLPLWLLLFSFVSVIGFWNIGGVRMWTAAHVFFYGAALYFLEGKKKGLLLALLSILIHFSFILPVALLLLFYIIRMPIRILFVLFVVSFFVSTLDLGFVKTLLESYIPDFLVSRVSNYVDDEYIDVVSDISAGSNWYIAIYIKALSWFIFMATVVIYFSRYYVNKLLPFNKQFFGFCLAFLALGNILALMPSGARYLLIAQLFAMAMIFITAASLYSDKLFQSIRLLSPILAFYLIISLRVSFDTITLMTIFGNPLLASFVDFPFPLIDLIK